MREPMYPAPPVTNILRDINFLKQPTNKIINFCNDLEN